MGHGFASDYFVKLAAFDEFHAEIAGAIALADFVNGNNAWMLEAGGGFCFAAESLKMCFRGPVTEANYFDRDCAVETFLSRAINYALTAAANFLQQLVVAKVRQHPRRACSYATARRRCRIHRPVNFLHQGAKACLQ